MRTQVRLLALLWPFLVACSEAQTGAAQLASPGNGATNVDAVVPVAFTWNAVSDASQYFLYVGVTPGGKEVFSGGGTGTKILVRLQPSTTYYAKLCTKKNDAWYYSNSSFQTGTGLAHVQTPVDGITELDPAAPVEVTWNAISDAQNYYLFVGTAPGAQDVYSGGGLATSASVRTNANTTYYAMLGTLKAGIWYYSNSRFQTGTGIAHVQTPGNGATNLDPASPVQVTWNGVSDAERYYLYVGTTAGGKDVYSGGGTGTSAAVKVKPATTYYALLCTQKAGVWRYSRSVFQTGTGIAHVLAPPTGATNLDPGLPIQFTWNAVPDAEQYYLFVGTTPGAQDVYSGGGPATTASVHVNPGITYYAMLGTKKAGTWYYSNSTFQTGTGIAHVQAPADGASDVDPTVPVRVTWNTVSDAEDYYLYIGTSSGGSDVFSGRGTSGTATVSLRPSTTYYARMCTKKVGAWQYSNSSFHTGTGIARLLEPLNGASGLDTLVKFGWSAVSGALKYYLYVGTSPGAKDAYDSGEVGGTTLSALLAPSRTYYARLWTKKDSGWLYADTSFTTGTGMAHLTAPADGAVNVDPSVPVPFQWSAVSDAIAYSLQIGSYTGGSDVYSSGDVPLSNTTVTLSASSTYYARLCTKKAAGSSCADSSFTTGTGIARLTAPRDGDVDVDPFAPIKWNAVSDATQYYVFISEQPGGRDLYFSYPMPGNVTSRLPWGLEPGKRYYAQLATKKAGVYYYDNVSFTTAGPEALPDQSTFYAAVRDSVSKVRHMTQGYSNAALSGTALADVMQQRFKSAMSQADCTDYAFTVLRLFTQRRILARYRGISLNSAPTNRHAITEYWDPFNSKWTVADPTFGLVYSDPLTNAGQTAEEVGDLVRAGSFASIEMNFVTEYVDDPMQAYYMDPVGLYTNVIPMGGDEVQNATNPPDAFLKPQSLAIAGTPGVYTFHFDSPSDGLVVREAGASADKSIGPQVPAGWGNSITLQAGWAVVSASPGVQIYTFNRLFTRLSHVVSPGYGAKDVSPDQAVLLTWSSAPDAQLYDATVGTTLGGQEILSTSGTATSASIIVQPATTYYVRIGVEKNGAWYYTYSSFSTGNGIAHVLTPADGATEVDPSLPVIVSWSTVSDAQDYYLFVGTSPGAGDVFSGRGASGTASVRVQPATQYYAMISTLKNGAWYYSTNTFRTGTGIARVQTPADGSTNIDPSTAVQITWNPISDAQLYQLSVGTVPGGADVLSTSLTGTTASVSVGPGTTYYVRLGTEKNSIWYNATSTFQTGYGPARLTNPSNGATGVDTLVQFSWNSVSDALKYYVYLGTSVGAKDVYDSGEITATSLSLTVRPSQTYYVRLWTKKASGWAYSDSSFSTGTGLADLLTPHGGDTGINAVLPVQFSWRTPVDAVSYRLCVSIAPGACEVYDSGEVTASTASVALSPSTAYYVRLYTNKASVWGYRNYTIATGVSYARFTQPLNGATNVDPFAPVTWATVPDADYYFVRIAEDPSNQVPAYYTPTLGSWVGSQLPWGLEPDKLYYAWISTKKAGTWYTDAISFRTAAAGAQPSDAPAFYSSLKTLVANTRYMATQDNTALPNTPLYQVLKDARQDPDQPYAATCGVYALTLLHQFSQARILARRRDVTFTAAETHVTVEYRDPFLNKWVAADPTFGMVYLDDTADAGTSADEVGSMVRAGNGAAVKFQLVTTYGDLLAKGYRLDPLLLYNNVVPIGADVVASSTNPVDAFVTPQALPVTSGAAGYYMFHFSSATGSVTVLNPGVQTIAAVSTDGWSLVAQLSSGWSVAGSVPAGTSAYAVHRVVF